MQYRREIDGLRALAVLPVIFFHAGWTLFSGGFVGVDVFFVISGFLVSTIVLTEKAAGTFSLAKFYERRARRILPALFLVMLVCLPFAWRELLPADMNEFAASLISVCLFSANFFFELSTDYFDTAAELKPLLHTWSLAVEEQFYFLLPGLLYLVNRVSKAKAFALICVVALGSLLLSQWALAHEPSAVYYLLPFRAWELLLGCLLAWHMTASTAGTSWTSRLQPWHRELGGAVGLIGLLFAAVFFDGNTPFPGFHALVPTLGAALIIVFASEKTTVGALLGSRLLVGLGMLSYSLYLWHQPVFAFARQHYFDEQSGWWMPLLVGISLALAYLTWRFVERPMRQPMRLSRQQVFGLAAGVSVLFLAMGVMGRLTHGFAFRLSAPQRAVYDYTHYSRDATYRKGVCFLKPEQGPSAFSASCQAPDGAASAALLWGDSHAAALYAGLHERVPNLAQYTASGCPPIEGFSSGARPKCAEVIGFVMKEIARTQPSYIYLHADWPLYRDVGLADRMRQTLSKISAMSPKSIVVLVGAVPQYPPNLPLALLHKGMTLQTDVRLPTPLHDELMSLDRELRALAGERVHFHSAMDAFCDQHDCRVTETHNGVRWLTAWDYGHLTLAGSELLARSVVETDRPMGHSPNP